MAKPVTASWSKLLIMLGDGADPETFAAPCALVTKGIAFSADTSDSNVPDCDDPDLPSWVDRNVRSLSAGVTGSGLLALGANGSAVWREWYLSGEARNLRIKIDVPLADDGGYFAGAFVLTGFTINGSETDGKIGTDLAMASSGEITWVPASA